MSRSIKDQQQLYRRLPTFVCMMTGDRIFIVGKCSITGFPQENDRVWEYAYMPEMPDFRSMDDGWNGKQADRYTRQMRRTVIVREIVDPDSRTTIYGLNVEEMAQAYELPNFTPNISLIDEMVDAWSDMLRQETEHLHQHIARLEGRIDDLTYTPKNTIGSSPKPQRRITLSEESS